MINYLFSSLKPKLKENNDKGKSGRKNRKQKRVHASGVVWEKYGAVWEWPLIFMDCPSVLKGLHFSFHENIATLSSILIFSVFN